MGNLTTQALVSDVVSEFNGTGSGPYTLFNVSNVTSGQIYDKITEANAMLQQATGQGSVTPTDAALKEGIKRFEVNYASARLGADLIGVIATDGFNVTTAGTSIQRMSAEYQTYVRFIEDHLKVAKWWIVNLHQWFFVGTPDNAQGLNEMGVPISYWSTTPQRMG